METRLKRLNYCQMLAKVLRVRFDKCLSFLLFTKMFYLHYSDHKQVQSGTRKLAADCSHSSADIYLSFEEVNYRLRDV